MARRKRSAVGVFGTWLCKFEKRPGCTYYAVCHHPTRCDLLDPHHACTEVLGYYGQTRRKPEVRWKEHQFGGGTYGGKPQPWADTIIRWERHRHGRRWSGFKLDRVERIFIRRGIRGLGRPLYNVEHNQRNWHRIKPWEAVEQRAQRDLARGRMPSIARAGSYLTGQLDHSVTGYDSRHVVQGVRVNPVTGKVEHYGSGERSLGKAMMDSLRGRP